MKCPSSTRTMELAEKHVARHRGQLERAMAGNRGYRANECKVLLDLWVSVRDKGGVWRALSQAERDEVMDAVLDEDE